MGLDSPKTFGEYYWSKQVDASKFFADDSEKQISPYIAGLLDDIPLIDEFPSGLKRFVNALAEPSSFAFLPFMAGVGLNAIDEALDIAFEPAMSALKREYGKRFKSKWLSAAEVNILWSRNKITEGLWDEVIAAEGYESVLGTSLFEAQLPYPSISDLVLYSRYHGDPDNPWGEFNDWFNISPREWPVWKWLGLQRLTTLQTQALYKRGLISDGDFFTRLARIGWQAADRPLIEELGWTVPNAMLLVQGDLMQGISEAEIIRDISFADINPKYARTYLDAILTKPASQDIIAYELRQDPSLSGLAERLRKIGIHPEYAPLYKELAYQIPPIADIITMAVREAFSPEIAAKFGQYQDYPKDLEEWASKKGLSSEWSQRYWASHWSLPSAQQGFEMLHRGVINQSELNLLLRALDIMPFWRERLTSIAYKRMTRVDIRRMYQRGIMNETEVYEAYLELGYNERDARRMSDFTIKQILATQSKFTTRDVVTAYSKYMISSSEARSLLLDIGVRQENISYILSTAEYKREWALTEDRIAAIRNLYKKAVYSEDDARGQLLGLNLPSTQVDNLMSQWYVDEKDKPPRYWTTAQTLSFMKDGLITQDRGKQELANIGYDTEHIGIYLEASK